MNNGSGPALLTRRQACAKLSIGLSRYKCLVAAGCLREVAIGERGRRLPLSEVDRFILERLETAAGDDA